MALKLKIEKKPGTRKVWATVPDDIAEEIEDAAAINGVTISKIVAELIVRGADAARSEQTASV